MTDDRTDTNDLGDLTPETDPPPVPRSAVEPVSLGNVLARVQLAAATPEREAELARREAESRRRRRGSLRVAANSLGIPEDEDLREVVLDDDAPVTEALAVVRRALAWRGDRARGLILVLGGEPGTGKTAAIAHALARVEQTALFVSAAEIGATPRNGYSDNAHAWRRWESVAVLAVDDVGLEQGDPSQFATLLTMRHDAGRATLVSTNLGRKDFVARYITGEVGPRLIDRLVNKRGRATRDAQGRVVIGPGGQAWYVATRGASLRSAAARVALRARTEGAR